MQSSNSYILIFMYSYVCILLSFVKTLSYGCNLLSFVKNQKKIMQKESTMLENITLKK